MNIGYGKEVEKMIKIRPTIIEKNKKKEFVVLPYEDFLKIQEELEDYEDLKMLRRAKRREGKAPAIELKDVKKQWGLERE
jgi:PHD/YefM family antitoxin component YafN of YafNO toxin-antitoxin module